MTSREEILNKIKLYEAKWGKLGTGRIMDGNDNLIHSAERSTDMSKSYDNSYYEYRRKVLEGKEKNKLAHMKTFSPREMNQQFYDDMISSGRLVHAATMHDGIKPVEIPNEYLEHIAQPVRRDNSKYYQVIVLPNGKSRYFYTKAEWDAYNKSGEEAAVKNSGSMVNKEKKKAVDDSATANYTKNKDAATVKKYGEIARKSPEAAAKEIVKTRDFGLDEFMYDVEEGFKNGSLSLDEDGRINGDTEDIEYYTNNIQKWCKWVGEESGSGAKVRDAVGEMISDEIEALWKKYGKAKHSAFSFEDDDVLEHATNDSLHEEELIDEYKAFMARAKAGKEKNTLAHSKFISPAELNRKYHEDYADECVLIHTAKYGPASGTNKYYAKIDDFWGKGKPRYFYSKAEWDGYQNNKKASQQSGADRASKEKSNADPRSSLEKAQSGREAAINKAYTDEQKRRIAEQEKKNKADAYNKNKADIIRKNEEYAKNADKDMNSKKSEKATKQKETLESLRQDARDNMDYMFKQSSKDLGISNLSEDSYAKQAYERALAEINDISLDEIKKDRQLYSKLLTEADEDPKKAIEVSKAMRKNYDKIVNDEVKKVKDTLKAVKKFFNPKNHEPGEGSVNMPYIDKDGEQVVKEIEEKLSEAMKRSANKNLNEGYSIHSDTDAYMDFLGSLSKEEKSILAVVYDYYHENYRPGLLRNAQESREWEEHKGQVKLKQEMNKN